MGGFSGKELWNKVVNGWSQSVHFVHTHRMTVLKGVAALTVGVSVSVAGNQYVHSHLNVIYKITIDGETVGAISNPALIDDLIAKKEKEIQEANPNVKMVLVKPEISPPETETVFNGKTDDDAILAAVSQKLSSKAMGVQLKVDGKVIAVLKDKETADQVLGTLKSNYLAGNSPAAVKGLTPVTVLSAGEQPQAKQTSGKGQQEQAELQSIDFVQNVGVEETEIQPQDLANPQDVVKKLETGDVQPTKYTVQEGDCVSCIAKKLGISKDIIYANNPQVKDDRLKIGAALDVTMLQPTLSIKTEEKITEVDDIQYETQVVTDDTMKAGKSEIVTPGKVGKKRVTFLLKKVNGFLTSEELLNEEVLEKPTPAVIKKGTKIIKGEGTGNFIWPVSGSRVSSGFGMRDGRLHKGVDLIGGNKIILAADNGRVTYAGFRSDYGNMIVINHSNGYETVYAHLSKIGVSVGSTVEKGEKIGVMGETGDADGVHLHFEVHMGGELQNPMKYLNR